MSEINTQAFTRAQFIRWKYMRGDDVGTIANGCQNAGYPRPDRAAIMAALRCDDVVLQVQAERALEVAEERYHEAQNGYNDHVAECRRLEARVRQLEQAAKAYIEQADWAASKPGPEADAIRAAAYAELRRVVYTTGGS